MDAGHARTHACMSTSSFCVLRMQAKELGIRSVILDGPDSWSQNLVGEGIAEKFLPIDFADQEAVFERCCIAIRQAKKVRPASGGFSEGEALFNVCPGDASPVHELPSQQTAAVMTAAIAQ